MTSPLLRTADFDRPNREVEQRSFAIPRGDDAPVPYRSSRACVLVACRELKTTQNRRHARFGRDTLRLCTVGSIDWKSRRNHTLTKVTYNLKLSTRIDSCNIFV